MPDIRNFDADTREFFDSLPKFVQEDIMQSDLEIRNKKDLKQFAGFLLPWRYSRMEVEKTVPDFDRGTVFFML
ncbi:MAG: hypothetical protein ACLR23_14140 [Clostridia bacterium]